MDILTFIIAYADCLLFGFALAYLGSAIRGWLLPESYAEKLLRIHDLLTEDNWGKSRYFKLLNGNICMCVQGVAIYISNPVIRDLINQQKMEEAYDIVYGIASDYQAHRSYGAACGMPRHILGRKPKGSDLLTLWKSRPTTVSKTYKEYGNSELNYLLGMFGIDTWFNDDAKNLNEVKQQIIQAVRWAKANQKFLSNN